MDATKFLEFTYAVKLDACGFDIRKMLPEVRDVLLGWLNGEVPTSIFLRDWPMPGGDEPLSGTVCLVNALAPVL